MAQLTKRVENFSAQLSPLSIDYDEDKPFYLLTSSMAKGEFTVPQVKVVLDKKSFLIYLSGATLFFVGFSVVFFFGVIVHDDLEESVGTSKMSSDLVEKVNTISGFTMELLQVLVWLGMARFFPAFSVYLHDLLFPDGEEARVDPRHARLSLRASIGQWSTWSRWLRLVAIAVLPFAIKMSIENSFKSFQASTRTVGYIQVMTPSDLKVDTTLTMMGRRQVRSQPRSSEPQSNFATSGIPRLENSVLKNAMEQRTKPFQFRKSNCTLARRNKNISDKNPALGFLTVDALSATSVVYGFTPREWNAELFTSQTDVRQTSPAVILNIHNASSVNTTQVDLHLQYDLFMHAKILIERALSATTSTTSACEFSESTKYEETTVTAVFQDTLRHKNSPKPQCRGAISSLPNLATDYSDRSRRTLPNLITHVVKGIEKSLTDMKAIAWKVREDQFANETIAVEPMLDTNATTVSLEQYNLKDTFDVNAMRIDVVVTRSWSFVDTCENKTTCNRNRVTYPNPVPTHLCGESGCLYSVSIGQYAVRKQVLMVPFMKDCDLKNATYDHMLRGYDVACVDREHNAVVVFGIGSYVTYDELSSGNDGSVFLESPNLHIRFTVAKINWTETELDNQFGAKCEVDGSNCTGLAFKLEQTGRFVMAGAKEALPKDRLNATNFNNPIPLVVLNEATADFKGVANSMEYIRANSKEWKTLSNDSCSRLVESYANHIESNAYKLEQPLQVMYTAALFFLFENASVTAINDTRLLRLSSQRNGSYNSLDNLKLSADQQVREVRVVMPNTPRVVTMITVLAIVVLVLVVILSDSDPLRKWEHSSHVQEFIAIHHDENYSERFHKRQFAGLPPGFATEMDKYRVHAIRLRRRGDEEETITLN